MTHGPFDLHDDAAVYVISVAAELTGLHPQTLRQYDRLGLVSPGRTSGRGRRYSARDISTLREVARLSAEGVSLVGIKRILELEAHIDALQRQVAELQARLSAEGRAGRGGDPRGRGAGRAAARGVGGGARRTGPDAPSRPSGRDIVPLPGTPERTVVVWTRTEA